MKFDFRSQNVSIDRTSVALAILGRKCVNGSTSQLVGHSQQALKMAAWGSGQWEVVPEISVRIENPRRVSVLRGVGCSEIRSQGIGRARGPGRRKGLNLNLTDG